MTGIITIIANDTPVATELDEFLDQHRIAAPPEAESRLPRLSSGMDESVALIGNCPLSGVMRSMNTSSSDGSLSCQCRPFVSR